MNADHLHVLGGGPAGLAAAYYAHREGIPFTVFEAGAETGGNCRTLRIGDCAFDTGAHRLHARDPEITAEFRALLGEALLTVEAPSRIVRGNKTFRFPPEPLDLLRNLNTRSILRILGELFTRARFPKRPENFESLSVHRYGKTLADLFLLGYTRKLWGRAPALLSPAVAGGRLKGLHVGNAIGDALRKTFPIGRQPLKAPHLDGAFLYPKQGIGSLFHALEAHLPAHSVRTRSRVTRIRHERGIITGFTVNGSEEIPVRPGEGVVSTLPLPVFLRALDPPPPSAILARAEAVVFRNLMLCVLRLDIPRYSDNASLYFPDPGIPFTRLYEPKNRSPFLAPQGRTCIVLEIPCDPGDSIWNSEDSAVVESVLSALEKTTAFPFRRACVLETAVHRVSHAYPVLALDIEPEIGVLLAHCAGFSNLRLAGRNALFRYAHIHDMFRQGRDAVEARTSRNPRA